MKPISENTMSVAGSLLMLIAILLLMILGTGCNNNPVDSEEHKPGTEPLIMYRLTTQPSNPITVHGDSAESVNNNYSIYKDGSIVFNIQADSIIHERTSVVK